MLLKCFITLDKLLHLKLSISKYVGRKGKTEVPDLQKCSEDHTGIVSVMGAALGLSGLRSSLNVRERGVTEDECG